MRPGILGFYECKKNSSNPEMNQTTGVGPGGLVYTGSEKARGEPTISLRISNR